MGIGATVGKGGNNDLADVIVVQHLLNEWLRGTGQPVLPTDGDCGPRTIAAIVAYQGKVLEAAKPDGLVTPNGRTWQALANGEGVPVVLSGARWWHANQAKYPNSEKLSDLAPPFRECAEAFVAALKAAGARVKVSATRRSRTRAYLMHYCWRVARGELLPSKVPTIAGCTIKWDHGDAQRSRQAAAEMVDLFDIAFPPSLTSLHIDGRAIDMTITWTGTLDIRDDRGKLHKLGAPRSGDSNAGLHAVGASYGCIKLASDPPHWSDNGR